MNDLPRPGSIWVSLPMPALVIDHQDKVRAANPAAETFLNMSARSVLGTLVTALLSVDAPVLDALQRCRVNQSEVYVNDVVVSTTGRASMQCTIQIAPLQDQPGSLLMLISPRVIADRLGRAMHATAAAKDRLRLRALGAEAIASGDWLVPGRRGDMGRQLEDEKSQIIERAAKYQRRDKHGPQPRQPCGKIVAPEARLRELRIDRFRNPEA